MPAIFVEVTPPPSFFVETFPTTTSEIEVITVAPTVVLPTPMFVPVDVLVQGPAGPSGFEGFTFSYQGSVAILTGKGRQYFEASYQIDTVRSAVGTQPVGSALIVDVKKNGVSIFTTTGDRPTINPGSNTALGGSMAGAALVAGDFLTVDVVQVGSGTPGSDLTVTVRVHKTG